MIASDQAPVVPGPREAAPERGKRRQTLYLPSDIASEMASEASRQGRSGAWLMRQAWRLARATIARFPARPVMPALKREGEE